MQRHCKTLTGPPLGVCGEPRDLNEIFVAVLLVMLHRDQRGVADPPTNLVDGVNGDQLSFARRPQILKRLRLLRQAGTLHDDLEAGGKVRVIPIPVENIDVARFGLLPRLAMHNKSLQSRSYCAGPTYKKPSLEPRAAPSHVLSDCQSKRRLSGKKYRAEKLTRVSKLRRPSFSRACFK